MEPRVACEGKMEKKIAIIGAGISGLLACKHTWEKGFNPIVFEAKNCIGGVWSTNTITSTKLQTPKNYYQFSDFAWPSSVTETFPHHKQVMSYLNAYATHFNVLAHIKFNTKVISVDYSTDEDMSSGKLWGGTGEALSPKGKWSVRAQDLLHPFEPPKVYEVWFVIMCTGKFSDLPNMPQFPMKKGPEVFGGEVIHSMQYAAMGSNGAAEFIKGKQVAVVGFQKSALDIAAEVAQYNGAGDPTTLIFKTAHWTVPEALLKHSFRNLNRFSELFIHKPGEGFFFWFLAILLSPLLWIFEFMVESYLKWTYPLNKYGVVPEHGFLSQISSCKFTVLPDKFYDKVEEGSIILKKVHSFSFCKSGLIIDNEAAPLQADVVIFATGYRSQEKITNLLISPEFRNIINRSTAPFYRECIIPRIPQLAILGYSESPSILFTTEMRTKWLASFLAGQLKLPTMAEMEEDGIRWEKCIRRYAGEHYKRGCASVLLQVYCNDQLCRDMNCNPWRKKRLLAELFCPYAPSDYADLCKD